jgi:tetratricopeptide (TPR) repeat protein
MAMIFDWDLKTADEFMQEALKLEPENPIVIDASASVAGYLGRFDEAIALKKSALQKDPLNHITRNNLGIEYYYAGQLDMAKRTFRELLELNPKFRGIHTMISGIYLREGKVDSALLEIINETETGFQLYGSARAYFASGQLARADSFLHAFINEFSPVWDFQIAEVYAFRNEPDKAFEFLESAFMQKDPGFLLIRVSPFLDNIRQDPRYRELLKRVNLDVEKG